MSVVLVGVDGSEPSRRAMLFACERAQQLGFELLVVHVIHWSPYSFNTPAENERRHSQKQLEIKAAQEQVVDPAIALADEAGVPVEGLVRHGHPVDVILDLARERDAAYIVVGRTGDSRMRQAVFGSTPGHLVQLAPVPVTVVP
jgi:nucleotide-binding universal stress UspA family protein